MFRSVKNWLKGIRGPAAHRCVAPVRRRTRLGLEALEDRQLMSGFSSVMPTLGAGTLQKNAQVAINVYQPIQIIPADTVAPQTHTNLPATLLHYATSDTIQENSPQTGSRYLDFKERIVHDQVSNPYTGAGQSSDKVQADISSKYPNPDVTGYPLPQLSSLPGAQATLYLNFSGDSLSSWSTSDVTVQADGSFIHGPKSFYQDITMGAYDSDANPGWLNHGEYKEIQEIWARVAEDFAPFNLNVTTVKPAVTDDGWTVTMDIGDSHGWYNNTVSADNKVWGISDIGAFSDNGPHVAFAFTDGISDFRLNPSTGEQTRGTDFAANVADTVSHEAGHEFGLSHHLISMPDGTTPLDKGSLGQGPIMGDTVPGTRNTFGLGVIDWTGDTKTPILQWDIGKIASAVGYRADDYGDDQAHAHPLSFNVSNVATLQGVVGIHPPEGTNFLGKPDMDVFSFNTSAGPITINADVLAYKNGNNLLARAELWSDNGPIAVADPDGNGNAALTANLTAGKYYVKVMSGGGLADIGGYTLTVQRPRYYADSIQSTDTSGLYPGSTHVTDTKGATLLDLSNLFQDSTHATDTIGANLLPAQTSDSIRIKSTTANVFGAQFLTASAGEQPLSPTDSATLPSDPVAVVVASVADLTNGSFAMTDAKSVAHQLQIQSPATHPDVHRPQPQHRSQSQATHPDVHRSQPHHRSHPNATDPAAGPSTGGNRHHHRSV